jgi:amino acid permease
LFGGLAIALITSELGVVMGLIGATGATIITFILPGAAYYKMHPWGTGPAWKRVAAAALCITGCIIMPFCVTMIFV